MKYVGGSKVKLAAIIGAVLVVAVAASFFTSVYVMGKRDIIFPGVRVADIDLGGLTGAEARDRITEQDKALGDRVITVKHPGGSGVFRLRDAGFHIKVDEVMANAHALGRQGSLLAQWRERGQLARNGREVPLAITADKNKLKQLLDEITKAVRVPPRDALLVVNDDDTVQIIESTAGYGVDMDKAWDRLQEVAVDRNETELSVEMVAVRPARTTEDVRAMGINGLVASFTTRFDLRKTNRAFNIKVAAQALDGIEIKPGEVFSFNKIVGPRSQEAGYKPAPAILNNEFIDSLGGGVCQVSTTLYNTLLLADVQIIERSSHSLVVSYVPLGQDAAVAYGGKNLRFKNNYDTHLLTKSKVVGNSVTFKLFGDIKNKKYVKVLNTTIEEFPFKTVNKPDPTLPAGKQTVKQKGARGYTIISYRLVYSGGQLIKKEKLPNSFYNPLDQIILIGSGRAAYSTGPLNGTDKPPGQPGQPGQSGDGGGGGTTGPVTPDPGVPDDTGSVTEPGAPAEPAEPGSPPPGTEPVAPIPGT